MKKSLVALAALAVVGAASAQSTVNLTGVVGFGYQSQATPTLINRGLMNTDASLFVNVTEDLGGGLKAIVSMNLDSNGSTSTPNFAQPLLRRNTSLSLAGGFGMFTLGSARSSDLITKAFVAPSALPDGLYDSSGIISRSAGDYMVYTSPNMSGFTGSVTYFESTPDGSATATVHTPLVTLNYANGPLAAGLTFKHSTGTGTATFVRKSNAELYATYDIGVAKFGFGYDGKLVGTTAANDVAAAGNKGAFALGVSVPLGAVTVGANFAKRGTFKVTELAAKYDLSKRTNVNASFGKQTADAGISNGNQYRLSLNHNF